MHFAFPPSLEQHYKRLVAMERPDSQYNAKQKLGMMLTEIFEDPDVAGIEIGEAWPGDADENHRKVRDLLEELGWPNDARMVIRNIAGGAIFWLFKPGPALWDQDAAFTLLTCNIYIKRTERLLIDGS